MFKVLTSIFVLYLFFDQTLSDQQYSIAYNGCQPTSPMKNFNLNRVLLQA